MRERLLARRRLRELDRRRPGLGDIIKAVEHDRLTYLEREALSDLAEVVLEAERQGLRGSLVEAGCGLGGSAIVLARAKSGDRRLLVFDVFGMIPPPSKRDGEDAHRRYAEISSGRSAGIGEDPYYGYQEDLYERVLASFRTFGLDVDRENIHLVKGLFQDIMHIRSPVIMAHIDADWYGSVRTCLERIEPHLVPGGRLVIDDYDHWSGARAAVDEYFAARQKGFRFERKARLHIVKEADSGALGPGPN